MKRLLVITLALFMITPIAVAKQIGDVSLPDSLMAGKDKMLLNGADFRKKFFMKMYVGGLYLKQKNTDPQRIIDADELMSLKLHIVSGMITAKKMTDAIDERLKRSVFLIAVKMYPFLRTILASSHHFFLRK